MVAPVEAPFSQRCIACLMVIYYIPDDDVASVTQEQELPPMTNSFLSHALLAYMHRDTPQSKNLAYKIQQ
jgi:hypothetical protein